MKEKIGYTFKIDRFEEFYVVAEVASFVGNPVPCRGGTHIHATVHTLVKSAADSLFLVIT